MHQTLSSEQSCVSTPGFIKALPPRGPPGDKPAGALHAAPHAPSPAGAVILAGGPGPEPSAPLRGRSKRPVAPGRGSGQWEEAEGECAGCSQGTGVRRCKGIWEGAGRAGRCVFPISPRQQQTGYWPSASCGAGLAHWSLLHQSRSKALNREGERKAHLGTRHRSLSVSSFHT